MSRQARYSRVYWDFDGTLASSAEDVWVSLEWAAASMGWQIPEHIRADMRNLAYEAEELYGLCQRGSRGQLSHEFSRSTHELGQPAHELGRSAHEFAQLVRLHYRECNSFDHTYLYPGVAPLLEDLAEYSTEQWIVTNKPKQALERVLATKGWSTYFDGWICPDGSTHTSDGTIQNFSTKADMLSVLQVQSPDCKAVMIGDSPSDIRAGQSLGIDTVGVLYGDGSSQEVLAAQPMWVVSCSQELEQVLFGRSTKEEGR